LRPVSCTLAAPGAGGALPPVAAVVVVAAYDLALLLAILRRLTPLFRSSPEFGQNTRLARTKFGYLK
jgi:hypothetical protein